MAYFEQLPDEFLDLYNRILVLVKIKQCIKVMLGNVLSFSIFGDNFIIILIYLNESKKLLSHKF